MNQKNFPVNSDVNKEQARSGSISGNVLDTETAAHVHRRSPVAAVIRPMQRVDGTDQSVRIDAAEPNATRAPHMRTNQLEDYVSWLREQAKRNPRAAVQEAAQRMVSGRAPESKPEHSPPLSQQPIQSSVPVRPPVVKTKSTTAQIQHKLSIQQTQRSDQAHALAGAHRAAPTPNVSPADFKFEADLERILKKLNMPEVLLPTEPHKKRSEESSGLSVDDQKAKTALSAASEKYLRRDVPVDSDHIIHTISQAIASVLNDHSETSVEAKIKSKLKTLSQSDRQQPMNSGIAEPTERFDLKHKFSKVSPVTTTKDAHYYQKTEMEMKADGLPPEELAGAAKAKASQPNRSQPNPPQPNLSQSNQTQSNQSQPNGLKSSSIKTPAATKDQVQRHVADMRNCDLDIPTLIAAWDVEDFRWPKVSNQMISTGASAIESLAGSVFEALNTTNKKRLAVTSAGRGEGATAIAISLARWAAAAGKRVLLVDADLASPGLSTQVGLGPNISWVNAISRSLDPSEVTIRSQRTPLCVMPLAPIETRVRWPRYIYDQLGDLINPIVSGFDLILFDLGPASQLLAELSCAGSLIDAALVIHNGNAPDKFYRAKERLEGFGIERFVVAQNTVHPASATRSNVA